jgi:hypothetical protein
MIPYIEIRNASRVFIGVIDIATSIIWSEDYYGAGSFEIFTPLTQKSKELLQIGYFVTKPADDHIAIIEEVTYKDEEIDGAMIIARGRMAKSLLDRRLAYSLSGHTITPCRMTGNVATACQDTVQAHAGTSASSARSLGIVRGSTGGITQEITADTQLGEESSRQSSYKNLLSFTDTVLQEYECGARITLNGTSLVYDCFEGVDRSVGNTDGNSPITFSEDFENLVTAEFHRNEKNYKNFALIGGAGDGLERFYSIVAGWQSGLERREMWVDASSLNRTYKDDNDEEQTYSEVEYRAMLNAAGKQQLNVNKVTETFDGVLDIQNSRWQYNRDFALGDIVTTQDDDLGKYVNVRLREVLEVQDENGYSIEANNQT